jgi:hypothetical protein
MQQKTGQTDQCGQRQPDPVVSTFEGKLKTETLTLLERAAKRPAPLVFGVTAIEPPICAVGGCEPGHHGPMGVGVNDIRLPIPIPDGAKILSINHYCVDVCGNLRLLEYVETWAPSNKEVILRVVNNYNSWNIRFRIEVTWVK